MTKPTSKGAYKPTPPGWRRVSGQHLDVGDLIAIDSFAREQWMWAIVTRQAHSRHSPYDRRKFIKVFTVYGDHIGWECDRDDIAVYDD